MFARRAEDAVGAREGSSASVGLPSTPFGVTGVAAFVCAST